jgi:hypothetical protein
MSAINMTMVPPETVEMQVDSFRGPEGKTGRTGDQGPAGPKGDKGFTPKIKLERVNDGIVVTATNEDGEQSEKLYDGGGVNFETDKTLKLEGGFLSVNTADKMEEDNTLPITSAAVFTEVGNINALLATI